MQSFSRLEQKDMERVSKITPKGTKPAFETNLRFDITTHLFKSASRIPAISILKCDARILVIFKRRFAFFF